MQDVMKKISLERLKFASFDERLSVVNLLVGKMADLFKEEYEMEKKFVEGLFAQLCAYKEELQKEGAVRERFLPRKFSLLGGKLNRRRPPDSLQRRKCTIWSVFYAN